MKQQILFIKGGEDSSNYRNQIECIKKWEYNPYKIKERWNMDLDKTLGDDYEIFFPISGLNKMYSNYEEWKVLFEKSFPFLRDGLIIIAHSLGGAFISKYLNENDFPVEMSKILLVAPAFKDSKEEVLGSFNFEKKLLKFRENSDRITMYYSTDDFVVPVSDFESYKRSLGNIKVKEFDNRGHFLGKEFPEIIEDIKNIK